MEKNEPEIKTFWTFPLKRRRCRDNANTRQSDQGFTLTEVLIALLVAMIGLMGTVAVQQAVLNATANATRSAVAMRLAAQQLEQFGVRVTRAGTPPTDFLAPIATGSWTTPVFLDANGHQSLTQTPANRYTMQTRVTDTGVGQPYNLSVRVSYGTDTDTPKVVQLDLERRKSW